VHVRSWEGVEMNEHRQIDRRYNHELSGSQSLFPSSSKDANLAGKEDDATSNDVLGSKMILEYDLERGINLDGKGVPS